MDFSFAAIDFETADHGRDSACSVGVVRVERGRIVARYDHLIRPPRRSFVFTDVHGITWQDVARAPTFRELWRSIRPVLAGVHFLAAHNAAFDRSVLRETCATWGLRPPAIPFQCTMKIARRVWNIRPTTLPDVCRRLRIPLSHHDAASDAEACARILLAAARTRRGLAELGGESQVERHP